MRKTHETGETITLREALDIFKDHREDIRRTAEEEIAHILVRYTPAVWCCDDVCASCSSIAGAEHDVSVKAHNARMIKHLIRPLRSVLFALTQQRMRSGVTEEEKEQARAYPVEDILEQHAVRRCGRRHYVCPFHTDANASLSIKGNMWKCFGCDARGDSIALVMQLSGMSFVDAVRSLC